MRHSTWLSELEESIRTADPKRADALVVGVEVHEGETVIGTLDEYHRRLYVVCYDAVMSVNAFVDALREKYASPFEVTPADKEKYLQLSTHAEAINEVFWASLQHCFESYDGDIGVREGLKVVTWSLDDVLGNLFSRAYSGNVN